MVEIKKSEYEFPITLKKGAVDFLKAIAIIGIVYSANRLGVIVSPPEEYAAWVAVGVPFITMIANWWKHRGD